MNNSEETVHESEREIQRYRDTEIGEGREREGLMKGLKEEMESFEEVKSSKEVSCRNRNIPFSMCFSLLFVVIYSFKEG